MKENKKAERYLGVIYGRNLLRDFGDRNGSGIRSHSSTLEPEKFVMGIRLNCSWIARKILPRDARASR